MGLNLCSTYNRTNPSDVHEEESVYLWKREAWHRGVLRIFEVQVLSMLC